MKCDRTITMRASCNEAMISNHKKDWLNVITDEFPSIIESHARGLVTIPAWRTVITIR